MMLAERGEFPLFKTRLRRSFLFRLAAGTLSPGDRKSGSPPCRKIHRDFVRGLNFYWVATAIGVMRPLAGLVE